ncbi:Fe2+-dependent dioxygenase [Erythrobacter sp. SCSIO 43205]|uniref:Fe2+-dependent dioxygenase n=1 Tax=Erythrobacter sp. SCSIO 43205 TaxID=2779361 RepID=UPI001CA8E053|nr:Fe2+-dependent dioxygenase [Erythrobacter sp. SCSIO 43205]UAB77932.1 Fe2+-dependent dioxygenase [Erythrobacter sp. SCSIO 43205]
MILSIEAISDADKLAEIDQAIEKLDWQDGRKTAGKVAARVKDNEQAIMASPAGRALGQMLTPLIMENPVVKAAVRPRRHSKLLVSKTQGGGHYGAHIDNALMGKGDGQMRTDVSFTLFLSDPASYEGGELVVQTAGMTQSIKEAPGHLILYPSTSIHEVRPVTSGTRIVAVGWIESLIRDEAQRELLFDMQNTRASLSAKLPANAPELLMIDKSIANLMRMWAEV